jgi:beta-1,4-N-acetylglucosaminyltransferase
MIFVTVGTQFPFDRLIKAVDTALETGQINEQVFAQTGEGSYKPRNFPTKPSLEKESFDEYVRQATGIISHAGMGSINIAMAYDKPMLVMPRLKKYGEVVNDHQVAISRKFAELGHILLANDEDELLEKIKELPSFIPRQRIAQPELVTQRIMGFLDELSV